MRNPNGYGGVRKLSGNRRRPYAAQITTSYTINEETGKATQKRAIIGYYATKKEAMIALAEYNKHPVMLDEITFGSIWQKVYDKMDLSHDRMTAYKRLYGRYFSEIDKYTFDKINAAILQNIVDSCPNKSATKTMLVAIMHKVFDYAIANNYTDFDSSRYVHYKRDEVEIERILFTHEEIDVLWQKNDIYSKFTLLLLYSGSRISELRELKKDDVRDGYFLIRKGKNARAGRSVPIHSKVSELFAEISAKAEDRLFPFNRSQYDYYCKVELHHTPYDTRHTFATQANACGIDKLIIQRIMGHTPDSVLEQTYTHLSVERLCAEVEKLKY